MIAITSDPSRVYEPYRQQMLYVFSSAANSVVVKRSFVSSVFLEFNCDKGVGVASFV